MRLPKSAKFITFEGGEGTGKSTQITLLQDFLVSRGHSVLATREPGGSPGGEIIRRLIVEGSPTKWDPLTEYLLLSASRRDHLEHTVKPALAAGQWILCDRFFDSSLAYQGAGHGLNEKVLQQIYALVASDFKPDLTLIFDVPSTVGLERSHQRHRQQHQEKQDPNIPLEDRFEHLPLDFHARVRSKFLAIADQNPQRYVVLDGSKSPTDLALDVQYCLRDRHFLIDSHD